MNNNEALQSFKEDCEKCQGIKKSCRQCRISTAIECIKKQIPAKPKMDYMDTYPKPLKIYYCPNCNRVIGTEFDKTLKNCPDCNQKLDWSKGEKDENN